MIHRLALSLLLAGPFLPAVISPAQSTIANDRTHRDNAIHWPKEFNPSVTPVFSHNELLIDADCHKVWTHLVDAPDWPNWLVLTKDVSIDGSAKTLQHGTLLHLKIFGSPINTTIDEFAPDTSLSWIPQGLDEKRPFHYHTWHLVTKPTGCLVVTEETGMGPNDIKDPQTMSALIHRAHDLWLASLKWRAEQ